jgi:hypothetical protein
LLLFIYHIAFWPYRQILFAFPAREGGSFAGEFQKGRERVAIGGKVCYTVL